MYRTPASLVLLTSNRTASLANAKPSLGMCRPPSTISLFSGGYILEHSSALISLASIPQEVDQPCFRFSSSILAGVVAISRPPTWLKQSRSTSLFMVYLASSVIVFEEFVWNTRPGACDVDPPGKAIGPCSTTVMFFQPRETSSSATLAPTMPAPMITTR